MQLLVKIGEKLMPRSLTIEVPSKKTSILAVERSGGKVVAHGTKMKAVIEKARIAGEEPPMIFHVPRQGQRYIY